MKLLILFVVAMCSAASALTEVEITEKWNDYKTQFEKNYPDPAEENFRKELFATNLKKIEEHNNKYAQGLVTYTMGVNRFADLTDAEKKPYTHGILRP